MLARLRPRLTYANVVATLALFAALGGSAYAVSKITTKQVKNRSLKGVDLRRNTLTGKEVREKTLGRVRNAQNARNAANAAAADIAKNAATATLANNANALGGQGAGSFEKSSRTQFGGGSLSPGDPSGEQVVLEWPELGARITTASNNGGCAGDAIGLRLRNTKTSGPSVRFFEQGAQEAALAPGAQSIECSTSDNRWQGVAGDSTGRTLFFDCQKVDTDLRCLGVRSEP